MRADRGAAIVWSLGLMALLGLVGYVGAAVGAVVVARQETALVADLAALAAAQATDDPCARAAAVAASNRVDLVDCHLDHGDIVVRVRGAVPAIASRALRAFGGVVHGLDVSARAGPPVG